MPIELECGQCQGRLVAEQPGSVVACPHCGTHLHVPGEPSGNGAATDSAPLNQMGTQIITSSAAAELVTSELESTNGPPPSEAATVPMVSIDESLSVEETPAPPAEAPVASLSELPSHSTLQLPNLQTVVPPAAEAPAAATFSPPPMLAPASVPAVAPLQPPASIPLIQPAAAPPAATVPRTWFIFVLSYASAVTLAFVFLLLTLSKIKTHPLESLPDIVPKIQKGEAALQLAPPEANVAAGHVLPLGESRRFGSVKVTPLRVTQGPLQFEHLLKDPAAARPPSEPVLKLWLRFENVSWNQEFSPLDPVLLYKRHYTDFGRTVLTNQFLCRTGERKKGGDLHHLFEMSPTSEFHLVGQYLNTEIGPGQAWETFIPSEERIDDLNGDLIWRVQFRKGYNSSTFHGVTTLIDIPFNRTDVKKES